MNKQSLAVRNVIELAAREIGGAARLIAWIKEDPANEKLFWSSMWIRLLPVRVEGPGPRGEVELINVKLTRDEMLHKLQERGLPTHLLDIDVPKLDERNAEESIRYPKLGLA